MPGKFKLLSLLHLKLRKNIAVELRFVNVFLFPHLVNLKFVSPSPLFPLNISVGEFNEI